MNKPTFYALMEGEEILLWTGKREYVEILLKELQERSNGSRPLYINEVNIKPEYETRGEDK